MKYTNQKFNQPFHVVRLLDTSIRVPLQQNYRYSLARKEGEPFSMERFKDIHHHLYYEFFFVLDGELTIVTETEKRTFSSSIVSLPPYYRHYSFYKGENAFALAVYLPKEKSSEIPFFSAISEEEPLVIPLSDRAKQDFLFYWRKLCETKTGSATGASKINALIRLIFLTVNENFSLEQDGTHNRSEEGTIKYIEDIQRFIAKHYEERDVRISALAEILHLSEKQTARIIRKEYGCTFSQLMNEHRLSVACMFLKNTDLSVGEIVEELNLGGENYFFSLFKKRFGMTPLQYRKMKEE